MKAFISITAFTGAVFTAAPTGAQEECISDQGTQSCVRVVACLGDGRVFEGQAFGWDTGTIMGSIGGHTPCGGAWDSTSTPKRAQVSCLGGLSASVIYFTLDPKTGTAVAMGRTSDGANVRAWSGTKVEQYFSDQGFEPGKVRCFGEEIPIS